MEKILEEIEQAKREPWYRLNNLGVKSRIDGAIERVIEIVRKHMSGKGMNVHANDGWIPVEERLPENGHCVLVCGMEGWIDAGWYVRGIWRTGFSAADIVKNIVAWQPLPKPYRPKQPETCKYTDGSCCWPIDQCKECPNHLERSEGE